jgi:hypothetical protein
MPAEGELGIAWRKWKKRFDIYLKATRQAGPATSDEVKTSLLLQAIGSEGVEADETLGFQEGQEDQYEVVLRKFDEFYLPN